MTQPAPWPSLGTDEQLSGRAADAIADMRDELRRRHSGLNTAEAQLAEVLLTAQAASETGRARLQAIQRQLIEAINNPVNALDTPAGERQFLMFLRGKIAEIQQVVDDGALTAHDQAGLIAALGNAYLDDPVLDDAQPMSTPPPPPGSVAPQSPMAAPAAGMSSMPAMGGLPQAAMPAASPSSGLAAGTSPLAGLASLLAGPPPAEPAATPQDAAAHEPEGEEVASAEEDGPESDDEPPAAPDDAPTEDTGPAETRPA
ncbi:MAG: DUF4226 domain-containing protein, partial [Mycobacterium sp.]